MKLDMHLHSTSSHDGKASAAQMIAAAKAQGLGMMAFTEHLDRDYPFLHTERTIRQLDLDRYREDWQRAVEQEGAGIEVLFGVECGFTPQAEPVYCEQLPRYPFDVIINSVHTVGGHDAYFDPYQGVSERQVYEAYLGAVLGSVRAQYDYDIIAHIGYVLRYAPFANKRFLPDYTDWVDAILGAIIARGKTLELNTNVKQLPHPFLPEQAVFRRYYELGGRNVSFGSDAHLPQRICEKWDVATAFLRDVGFRYWTVYKQRKEVKIPIQ